jgi:hypothetical protein
MRRISIVFQETDDKPTGDNRGTGQGYIVFMDGYDSERMKMPDDKLSAAEFWARKCFAIVVDIMKRTGAVVSEQTPVRE